MAESTLSITRADLLRHTGRFLGFDRNYKSWNASELQDINDILDSGLRQFYAPPILPGERTAWRWSFLRPTLTLATVSGTSDYALPDLFGGFVGHLAFAASDNLPCRRLEETNLARILQERSNMSSIPFTGPPRLFAVYPSAATLDGAGGQRFKVATFPTPDEIYSLTGEYFLDPYRVTDTDPYPLGGQPHSETLIESCLAASESQMDHAQGLHMSKFMERLAASVSFDRGASSPKVFGYNGDRSNYRGNWSGILRPGEVLYNGNSYLGG